MNTRNRRFRLALLAALVLSAPPGPCQETDTVFAPFPSRLRVAVKESLVILTWTDSPDLKGSYAVFRSTVPLAAESLPAAVRLAELATGVQTYTYSPPDSASYFYGVLALADDGSPYQVFIPTRNTTSSGVAAAVKPSPAATPKVAAPAPVQPFVTGVSAKARGDTIIVSYAASPKSRLVLYRGTAPIAKAGDLLNATLVAAFTDKDGNFADYPVPGVDYYYALLGEEDLKAGRISLALGVNSLILPTQVRAAAISSSFTETPPASRTPPLPYFLMEDGASGNGVRLPQHDGPYPARPVAPETEKAIAQILATAPMLNPAMPTTRLLPEELAAPSGGEDYALSIIVSDRMAAKDWAAAAEQLRKYLSLNRGPKASARARFYLGEALALLGSGREAFFEFLSARDFYPTETKPWIEYVLSRLREG